MHVVGMNEIEKWLPEKLLFGPTRNALKSRIYALEVAVGSGDTEHVWRQSEEPVEIVCYELLKV